MPSVSWFDLEPVLNLKRTGSDVIVNKASLATDVDILDAVGRAKAFRLCLRRIWAVAASLPDRENSLPTLIPAPGMFPVPSHNRQHHEHEQCTFDFCEHSRVDFTSVAQHHEKCNERCDHLTFPLELLNERVANGKPTAWKLDNPSLLDTSHPYMAVSHVWADGTGTGTWGPGKVNKCLYTFLCDIARQFQCEGCWWDTISIPIDDKARGEALNNMQNNYADAKITLVHDLYLREWEWVDAETACFAIVMSPWYSRGWTSLELAKSHKIKILFKARNYGYVIKDLDVDILAKIIPSSRQHTTAESIRKLRSASIQSFGDLLAILGPRDTSKPRDVPIISGLLAGVDVSGGLSQQEIYQRILRKLGTVAQGHLFHNSATMSAPGFSWCPTNILDMPLAESDSALLELRENGDLEGVWRVYAIDSIKSNDFIWKGTHPLTQVSLESALNGSTKEKHLLLVENRRSRSRALLVRLMKNEGDMLCCHFVGPVYFRTALGGSNKDEKCRETKVRIGSTERMQELPVEAWEYVCSMVEVNKTTDKASLEDTAATGRGTLSSKSQASFIEDDPISMGSKDWKALLYSETDASNMLFEESQKLQISKNSEPKPLEDMALFFLRGHDNLNSSAPSRAFFYGNQDIIPYVKTWFNQHPKFDTGRIMLLVLDEDDKIKDGSNDIQASYSLANNALLLATEKGEDSGVESLVTLLLDNHALHNPGPSGQTPLHLAVERGYVGIVEKLLTNKTNPANVDAVNAKKQRQSAIHVAAKKGYDQIAKLLVEKSKKLDAQEDKTDQTALHLAAQNGHYSIARLLLDQGANPNVQDSKGRIALHCAASGGHSSVVAVLLQHAVNTNNQQIGTSSHSTAANGDEEIDDKTNREADEKSDGETNEKTNGDTNGDINRKSNEKTARLELGKKAELDMQNIEGQTALHLAALKGDKHVVDILISHGANVCAVDESQQTPLLLAANKGHANIVWTLLKTDRVSFQQAELDNALLLAAAGRHKEAVIKLHEGGARSGLQDSEGMTALHWTIEAKDEHNTKLLIEKQVNVDIKDKLRGQSALLLAAGKGLKDAVVALLEKGANVNLLDLEGRTALHWAAIRRNVDIIKELLNAKSKSQVNKKDILGRTALHWAARSGSTEATELILDAQAHYVTGDNNGQSALILAATRGHAAAVKTLIIHGSDLSAQGNDKKTALDWAATVGSDKVVRELLIKIEADEVKQRALKLAANGGHLSVAIMLHNSIKDPNLRASALPTILFMVSATTRYSPVVDELISNITDPNYQDEQGRTALMLAVKNGNEPLIRTLLLRLNAKTDLQDTDGKTALMIATELNEEGVVRMLLDRANPDVQDKRKYTALHYAVEQGSIMNLYALLDGNANPNIPNSHKRTALHIAMEKLRPGASSHFRMIRRERIFLLLLEYDARLDMKDEEGQTPLHWAVRKNRTDVAEVLLQHSKSRNLDIDIGDAEGRTPLLLAAKRGYTSLVMRLLAFGFKPNAQDITRQTPLLLAAERGDHESVDALLEKEADLNLPDHQGRTVLSQAAQNGHVKIVRILLDTKRANPNLDARDAMGRTALLLAAENGHADIVATLLDHKANSTIAGYDGKKAWQKAMDKGHAPVVNRLLSEPDTPIQDRTAVNEALLLASRKGWFTLAEVLLGKEADVTFQSKEGWTALHMAAMSGHQKVVKVLLEKGISIIIKDEKARTALMRATEHGFESIVSLLLEREEVKTDIDGWMGQEALLFAAEKGYAGIVKLFLENSVNYNATDSAGRTAMALAAANGNRAIVELLLKQKASTTIKDKHKRTALHHAAWGGYGDVVEILLKHGADFSALDNRGQSALHLAAERASKEVIERLLEKRANANAKSTDGQTVLHRAAWGGSFEAVMLLRKNGADPFIRDNSENKPWQVAAEKGHESIVEALLEEEENVYDERISTKKGLIFAAQMGYAAIARSLLKKGAEPAVKDKDGLTPLHWAMKRGNKALVDLLIEKGEALINALDHQQQTALCLGVLYDQAAVVKILLQSGADANIPDKMGRTALHHAAEKGSWEIVQILVNHNADPHARDSRRKKAWQLAAEVGYHQIVRLLLEKEVDLDPQNQKREELFLQMAEKGSVPMVQLLLDKGVNKDAKDRFGRVAIGLAAEHGNDEVLGLLLSKGANLGDPDSRGQTPLLWAAKAGNAKIISSLLDKVTSESSDEAHSEYTTDEDDAVSNGTITDSTKKGSYKAKIVNHRDSEGRTALLIAVEEKHDNAVRLLLDKGSPGIDVNVQDMTDRTALQLAAERGNQNLVQLLLGRGAKPDLQDKLGRTALLLAVEQEQDCVVDILLSSSSGSVNIQDFHKRTALQVATERGNKDIIEALLGNKADANLADQLGRTALLLAAENGNKEVVDLLLKNGAKQECGDSAGRTPLLLAVANGDKAVVKTLLDHPNADVNVKDSHGRTLLHLAVQSGNKDVAWLVAEKFTSTPLERGPNE